MGKPKAKPPAEKARKAVGKTAQRARVTQKVLPCIRCAGPSIPILYYPEFGRARSAQGCVSCAIAWDRYMVIEGVPLRALEQRR